MGGAFLRGFLRSMIAPINDPIEKPIQGYSCSAIVCKSVLTQCTLKGLVGGEEFIYFFTSATVPLSYQFWCSKTSPERRSLLVPKKRTGTISFSKRNSNLAFKIRNGKTSTMDIIRVRVQAATVKCSALKRTYALR